MNPQVIKATARLLGYTIRDFRNSPKYTYLFDTEGRCLACWHMPSTEPGFDALGSYLTACIINERHKLGWNLPEQPNSTVNFTLDPPM
jgi:hypothetical protein